METTATRISTPVTRRGRKALSLIPPQEEIFAEGVFFKLTTINDGGAAAPSVKNNNNNPKSLEHSETTETTCFEDNSCSSTPCATPPCSAPNSWRSTDTASFHQHQPLMVSDPDKDGASELVPDEAEKLGQVMERSRRLPGTWYFSSNHVMINQERTKRVIAPLTRLSELDAIAREHAAAMAERGQLFHSQPQELHAKFNNDNQRFSRRMGENVARGTSIREIHQQMMKVRTDKHNILHRRYTHMGMATARGKDGQLYLCQVFRG